MKYIYIMLLLVLLTHIACHQCPEPDLLAISQVQRELCNRGYPVKIDGIYGRETQAAWNLWEKDMLNREADKWYLFFGGIK